MITQINLRDVSKSDRYAPDEEYAMRKARSAESQRPFVYHVEGDILTFDASHTVLSVEEIKDRLQWGIQWNSWEI